MNSGCVKISTCSTHTGRQPPDRTGPFFANTKLATSPNTQGGCAHTITRHGSFCIIIAMARLPLRSPPTARHSPQRTRAANARATKNSAQPLRGGGLQTANGFCLAPRRDSVATHQIHGCCMTMQKPLRHAAPPYPPRHPA